MINLMFLIKMQQIVVLKHNSKKKELFLSTTYQVLTGWTPIQRNGRSRTRGFKREELIHEQQFVLTRSKQFLPSLSFSGFLNGKQVGRQDT
jgi:hypothetical protein